MKMRHIVIFSFLTVRSSSSEAKLSGFTSRIVAKSKLMSTLDTCTSIIMTPLTRTGYIGKVNSTPRPRAAGITAIVTKPAKKPQINKRDELPSLIRINASAIPRRKLLVIKI